MEEVKIKCTICGIPKTYDCFEIIKSIHKGKSYATRRKQCIKCVSVKRKQYQQLYKQNHRIKIRALKKIYKKSHHEEILEQRRKYIRKIVNELSDGYVRDRLYKSFGIKGNKIPQELIESYRMQIKIKRLIKSKKNESTSTS